MSRATKRKHVTREVLEELVVPTGDQRIVRVIGGRGNNLHEVESATGEKFLSSMPSKFRKNVWIKRGNYVIVQPISEGNKVQAEITHILYAMQIKHLREEKLWPEQFTESKVDSSSAATSCAEKLEESRSNASSESDDESDLFVNTNRQALLQYNCTSSSDSDDG